MSRKQILNTAVFGGIGALLTISFASLSVAQTHDGSAAGIAGADGTTACKVINGAVDFSSCSVNVWEKCGLPTPSVADFSDATGRQGAGQQMAFGHEIPVEMLQGGMMPGVAFGHEIPVEMLQGGMMPGVAFGHEIPVEMLPGGMMPGSPGVHVYEMELPPGAQLGAELSAAQIAELEAMMAAEGGLPPFASTGPLATDPNSPQFAGKTVVTSSTDGFSSNYSIWGPTPTDGGAGKSLQVVMVPRPSTVTFDVTCDPGSASHING